MKILATIGKAHALKVALPAVGAGVIALGAVIDVPPFHNVWFDIPAGAFMYWLLQRFAASIVPPHEGSSDWYRTFHAFVTSVFNVEDALEKGKKLVELLKRGE